MARTGLRDRGSGAGTGGALVLAAALLAVASRASALPMMQTFGPVRVPPSGSEDLNNLPLQAIIPKFDPSLGPLVGVELTLQADFDPVDVSFVTQRPGDMVAIALISEVWVGTPSTPQVVDLYAARSRSWPEVWGGKSFTYESLTLSETALLTSGLGDFIGSGPGESLTLDIDAKMWPPDKYKFVGYNFIVTSHSPVAASYTVSGTYSYVPEPATLSLMAIGALGLWRRRKRI